MGKKRNEDFVREIKIAGDLDRHAAEALQLEIRRLAKRYGFEIEEFRIEKGEEEAGRRSQPL